jgi:hypothetical protein
MKKLIVLALFLTIAVSGAFAQDKAFGGGILYNNTSTSGSDDYGYDWTMSRNGFGAFAFFGLGRFWEFNLGFLYKNPSEIKVKYEGESYTMKGSEIALEGAGALQLGIYFKYPIPLSDMFVFFPTAGFDFEFSLSSEEYNGWEWWHDLWLRAGLGLDVFFTEKIFLRSHLIYGAAIPVGGPSDLGLSFGHGLLIKLGLGWML